LLSSIALSSWRVRAIYSLTKFKMKFPFTQNYLHSRKITDFELKEIYDKI